MAYDRIIDSARLNGALNDTAVIIGTLLAFLAGQQTIPLLGWDMDDGFAPDSYAYTQTHPMAGGSASNADISNCFRAAKAGTFVFASAGETELTISHGLGAVPDIVVVFSPDVIAGAAETGSYLLYSTSLDCAGSTVFHTSFYARQGLTVYESRVDTQGARLRTASTFQVKGLSFTFKQNATYYWIAATLMTGGAS